MPLIGLAHALFKVDAPGNTKEGLDNGVGADQQGGKGGDVRVAAAEQDRHPGNQKADQVCAAIA